MFGGFVLMNEIVKDVDFRAYRIGWEVLEHFLFIFRDTLLLFVLCKVQFGTMLFGVNTLHSRCNIRFLCQWIVGNEKF